MPTDVCSFLNIVFCSPLRAPVLVTYRAQEKYCCWTKPPLFFPLFFWVGSNTKLTRAMLVVVIRTLKWFFNFFICCTPAAPLNVILDSSPWESQSICGIFLSPSMVRFCSVHMEMSRSYLFVFYILIGVYHSQDDDYLKWTFIVLSQWSYDGRIELFALFWQLTQMFSLLAFHFDVFSLSSGVWVSAKIDLLTLRY